MYKTWLCANLDVAYLICVMAILGFAALYLPVSIGEGDSEPSAWFQALTLIGFVSIAVLFASKPNIGPIVGSLLLVCLYIFFLFAMNDPENDVPEEGRIIVGKMNKALLILSACSLIPAFFIARYAKNNFYDTVSRHWLYRNSTMAVFESSWKYFINRFCMAFLVILCLFIDLMIVCLFIKTGSLDELFLLLTK